LPLIDPDERELISRSIGDYTNLEEVPTRDVKTGTTSVSTQPVGVRLLTADAVGQIPTSDHIIFPNSKLYAKRPLQIRKTAHDDSRLKGIVTSPTGGRH
jgi:type IV secretion system protein VirD4